MFTQIYTKTTSFFASKKFFWAVVILFILESLWIAFSFKYPLIYDEAFHFPVIKIFSHYLTPLIFNQPHSYDLAGSLVYGNASLYHYLMSFPYRLIDLFTNNLAVQVVLLRAINVAMVAGGLVIFSRLFRLIGIRQVFINIALLIFVLIPLVPFVSATINYDNMLFPLTAWYLLLCVKLIKDKKVNWLNYAGVVIVGCFASLVKFTFLVVFAASIIYIAVFTFRKYGSRFLPQLIASLKKASKLSLVVMSVLGIIFIGLFSVRYLQSTLKYGSPVPTCTKVLERSRCEKNYSVKRGLLAADTKDQRQAISFPEYAAIWFSSSLTSTNRSVGGGADYQKPLPIIDSLTFFGIIIGLGSLLYAWRYLTKNDSWYFLATIAFILTVAVFLDNYEIYANIRMPYAIQPRYLLSILPIVLVMIVLASNFVLRKSRALKASALVLVLVLFTQGGGTITHILRSSDSWYWQNSKVIKANHIAKKVLAPFVKEN